MRDADVLGLANQCLSRPAATAAVAVRSTRSPREIGRHQCLRTIPMAPHGVPSWLACCPSSYLCLPRPSASRPTCPARCSSSPAAGQPAATRPRLIRSAPCGCRHVDAAEGRGTRSPVRGSGRGRQRKLKDGTPDLPAAAGGYVYVPVTSDRDQVKLLDAAQHPDGLHQRRAAGRRRLPHRLRPRPGPAEEGDHHLLFAPGRGPVKWCSLGRRPRPSSTSVTRRPPTSSPAKRSTSRPRSSC